MIYSFIIFFSIPSYINIGMSLNSNWHKQSHNSTNESYNYDDNQVGEDDVFMVS